MIQQLWNRMSSEDRTRFDELMLDGAYAQAVRLAGECLREIPPSLRECQYLLMWRADELGHHL